MATRNAAVEAIHNTLKVIALQHFLRTRPQVIDRQIGEDAGIDRRILTLLKVDQPDFFLGRQSPVALCFDRKFFQIALGLRQIEYQGTAKASLTSVTLPTNAAVKNSAALYVGGKALAI